MEVDPPPPSSTPGPSVGENLGLNPLKRSNSAPMLATTASQVPSRTCNSPVPSISAMHSQSFSGHSFPKQFERIRRYSTSSTGLFSPTTPQKTPSRLAQIINEERCNVKEREEAHERETHTNMQIYASCEELSLSDPSDQEPMVTDLMQKRPKSFQEPLHIFTSPLPYASSPSPTRIRKQCFSPSLGQPVRTLAGCVVTPSPSPSPTRKTFARRSISPISMMPGRPLLKRKINMESDLYESSTPQKRFQASHSCLSPGTSTPERFNSMSHPLLHSVSSSSLSDSSSPEQQVASAMESSSTQPQPPSQPHHHHITTTTTTHHRLHQPVPQSIATASNHHHHHQSLTQQSSSIINSHHAPRQPPTFPPTSRLSNNHHNNQHHQQSSSSSLSHTHQTTPGFGFSAFRHNVPQDSVETLSTSLSSSISQCGTESENSDMTESGEMIMDNSNMMMSHSGLNSSGGSGSLSGLGDLRGSGSLSGLGDLGGSGDFSMLSARFQQQQQQQAQKQSCKPTQL